MGGPIIKLEIKIVINNYETFLALQNKWVLSQVVQLQMLLTYTPRHQIFAIQEARNITFKKEMIAKHLSVRKVYSCFSSPILLR